MVKHTPIQNIISKYLPQDENNFVQPIDLSYLPFFLPFILSN